MIEERLEQALAALRAFDVFEAARLLDMPLEGRVTPRARVLWQQCVDAMPGVMSDWQRRLNASLAARTYVEHMP